MVEVPWNLQTWERWVSPLETLIGRGRGRPLACRCFSPNPEGCTLPFSFIDPGAEGREHDYRLHPRGGGQHGVWYDLRREGACGMWT